MSVVKSAGTNVRYRPGLCPRHPGHKWQQEWLDARAVAQSYAVEFDTSWQGMNICRKLLFTAERLRGKSRWAFLNGIVQLINKRGYS